MAPKLTFVAENPSTEAKEDQKSPAEEEEEDDDDDDDDDNDGENDGGEDAADEDGDEDEDEDDMPRLFVSSSSLSRSISFMLTHSLRVAPPCPAGQSTAPLPAPGGRRRTPVPTNHYLSL